MGIIRQWENYLSDSTQWKTKYSIISGWHLSFAPENVEGRIHSATWFAAMERESYVSKANKVFADRFLIALSRIKYMNWNGMHLQVGPFPTLDWLGCEQFIFFSSIVCKNVKNVEISKFYIENWNNDIDKKRLRFHTKNLAISNMCARVHSSGC